MIAMRDHVEVTDPITTAAGTFRIVIDYDPDGPNLNPRDNWNLGTMVCQTNRNYHVPREGDLVNTIDDAVDRGGWRLAVRYLTAAHGAVVLPIYGRERPSSTGELGETVDNDSSVSGVIYAMRSDIERTHDSPVPSHTEVAGWLASEVATYIAWANGETFDYTIERLADDCECDDDDCECWSVVAASGTYYSTEEAIEVARENVPTERELTDAQWLTELFEFELCGECGRDADQHIVRPDALGLRHAWCTDPIPESWSELATAAELTRRLSRDIEVTGPATAYAAIRLAGTVSGYGPVAMRWTPRTLSPARIEATWWQETGELASVAVYGNSTDQGLASKVIYWTDILTEAPRWVREFVTEHQPPAVHTWANGYGLWFARVPVSGNAASVAKAAIMGELRQRESNVCESRVGVELITSNRDTVVYREVDPDEQPSVAAGLIAESADGTIVALFEPISARWLTVSVLNSADRWEVVERQHVSASSAAVGDVRVSAMDIGCLVGARLLIELRDGNDAVLDSAEITAS